MYLCDRCQKSYLVGMNVSHSHRRTKTKNIPNLHKITVKVAGQSKTMRLCTKCTRIVRAQYPRVTEEVNKSASGEAKTAKRVENKEVTPEKEVVPTN